MNHASLFSGIGGFDLAARWMNWNNLFTCEINEFCTKILNYHFPDAEHYTDITRTDFSKWRGRIDVLSGGFPCQPFSLAGQRKGADDNRYLWPQMLRAIREIRPTWVVGENVAGILTMVQPGAEVEVGGQASLFGEDYRKRVLHRQEYVIETICRDLELEGYAVQPLLIPACAVGAPHRRDRIWFIAQRTNAGVETMQFAGENGIYAVGTSSHADGDRHTSCGTSCRIEKERCERAAMSGQRGGRCERVNGLDGLSRDVTCAQRVGRREVDTKVQPKQSNGERAYGHGLEWIAADPDGNGIPPSWNESGRESCHEKEWPVLFRETVGFGRERPAADSYGKRQKYGNDQRRDKPDERFKPQHSSSIWEKFPTQSPICIGDDGISGRLDGITFSKWRQESVKAYGNAVLPQVVYEIFRAINIVENGRMEND